MTGVFLYLEMYVLDVDVKAGELEVTVGADSAVLSETWSISDWEVWGYIRGSGGVFLNMNFVR